MKVFSILKTKSLSFSANIWSLQLIVNAIYLGIKTRKVVESFRKGTILNKSLPIVIHRIISILGSKSISFFSLSSEEDKAIVLVEIFLKIEKAETLFKKHFVIWQVWDFFFECTYLLSLELALENNLDIFGNLLIHWGLFWRLGESTRFINNLYGFFKLTIIVVRVYKTFLKVLSKRFYTFR